MSKACGLVTSCTRCKPMNSWVCPLANVRTRCAFQTFRNRVSAMGLQYNTQMSRAHLRYFFFTLAVAAAMSVARGHGQDAGALQGFVASFLPAIDRGVIAPLSHWRGPPEALARESMSHSVVALDRTGMSGAHYVAGRVI